jgi:hypothetical protein
MSEDSKELADAGSFGMEIHFHDNHCKRASFVNNLAGMIMNIAQELEGQGGMIGHVKLIAQTEGGFVKMSVVDIRLGVETVDELKEEKNKKGTIKLMAVVLGLKDETVEETVEGSLPHLGGCMDYHVRGHDCDHDH